jgi:Flp pilus assembly protein TadD
MATSRLEVLQQMLAQNPKDSFARYGVAMEYVRAGEFERAAAEFRTIIEFDPNYTAAYFHGGQSLEKLDKIEEARTLYASGVDACARTGNAHARSEMQAALDLLG